MPIHFDGEFINRIYYPAAELDGFKWSWLDYETIARAGILTNLSGDGRPISEDLSFKSPDIRGLAAKKSRDFRTNGTPHEAHLLTEMTEHAVGAMQVHDAARLLLESLSDRAEELSRREVPFSLLPITSSELPPEFFRLLRKQEIRPTVSNLAEHLVAEINHSNRLLPQYGIPLLTLPETIDQIVMPIRQRADKDLLDNRYYYLRP